MDSLHLGDRRWPEVEGGVIVLVPIGSLEQHGPHLPLDTDTTIASAVTEAVAAWLVADGEQVLVCPAIAIGASGEHQGFPGTVSIGHEALRTVVVEMVRSLSTWAERIVFVNGHGGNVPTLGSGLAQMRAEGHDVSWVACAFESAADAHAGLEETSVMLHLGHSRVAMAHAEAGRTEPLPALLPHLMAHGVRPVSPNGVLGDPTAATAAHGERLLRGLVDDIVAALRSGEVDDHARLTALREEARRGA